MDTDAAKPPPSDVDSLLRAGIAAAKAGQREQARELLQRVVGKDDRNVQGWLWLSGVVDDLANSEACLQHVLDLDPANEAAKRGLTRVRQQKVREMLQAGISAAKLGQRDHARNLLTRVTEMDDRNLTAWLWLSGVVNTLDDREICLENVLTLDPANEAARQGLEQVREQKALAQPARLEPSRPAEPGKKPAVGTRMDEWVFTPRDEFDNEYLCPYCATPTDPGDKKCQACGGQLLFKKRKLEARSTWLWLGLTLQIFDTLQRAAAVVAVFIAMRLFSENPAFSSTLQGYLGLPEGLTIDTVLRWLLIAALLFFSYSLFVTVAIAMRWKPGWYLFLIGAVLGLIETVAAASRFGATGLICGGLEILFAFGMILLAFQMQDDFFFDRTRILLHPDHEATSGLDFLAHGNHYAKRGMWAMAIVHYQRAAGRLADKTEPHLALARAYLHLKRYERAAQTLAEARRIDPEDPLVKEMTALVDKARGTAAAC